MEVIRSKSDIVGTVASGLCAVHCLATPFLFVAQSCSVSGCCESSPPWWGAIDYLFIGITFLAVYWSAKNTGKLWMKYALYSNWLILTCLIFNEKNGVVLISEIWKYICAFSLIVLHLYNRKYCQCSTAYCENK